MVKAVPAVLLSVPVMVVVPAPLTAFRSISKLEPGHWLLWKNGEIKLERYWQIDFSKKIAISEAEGRAMDMLLSEIVDSTVLGVMDEVDDLTMLRRAPPACYGWSLLVDGNRRSARPPRLSTVQSILAPLASPWRIANIARPARVETPHLP